MKRHSTGNDSRKNWLTQGGRGAGLWVVMLAGAVVAVLSCAAFAQTIPNQPDTILVANVTNSSVEKYGVNGSFQGVFIAPGSGGLSGPTYMTQGGPNGDIFVSSCYTHSVKEFDGVTGTYVRDFAVSPSGGCPYGVVWGPDDALWVAVTEGTGGAIERFDSTGKFLGNIVPNGVGGLSSPQGMTFSPEGDLWVCENAGNALLRYSQAGAFLGAVKFGTGSDPGNVRVGPDHLLYVSLFYGHRIEKVNPQTMQDLGPVVSAGTGNLSWPADLIIVGSDIYEVDRYLASVKRFSSTGQYLADYVKSGSGGLQEITGILLYQCPCRKQ